MKTVFRMAGNGQPPGEPYLSGRSVIRRKYERIIEHLAGAAGVTTIRIAAGARVDTIYSADEGPWRQAIDLIEALSRRIDERHGQPKSDS